MFKYKLLNDLNYRMGISIMDESNKVTLRNILMEHCLNRNNMDTNIVDQLGDNKFILPEDLRLDSKNKKIYNKCNACVINKYDIKKFKEDFPRECLVNENDEDEEEESSDDDKCMVCLFNIKEEEVAKLKCGHKFHKECVRGLRTCPLCRGGVKFGARSKRKIKRKRSKRSKRKIKRRSKRSKRKIKRRSK